MKVATRDRDATNKSSDFLGWSTVSRCNKIQTLVSYITTLTFTIAQTKYNFPKL